MCPFRILHEIFSKNWQAKEYFAQKTKFFQIGLSFSHLFFKTYPSQEIEVFSLVELGIVINIFALKSAHKESQYGILIERYQTFNFFWKNWPEIDWVVSSSLASSYQKSSPKITRVILELSRQYQFCTGYLWVHSCIFWRDYMRLFYAPCELFHIFTSLFKF